MYFLMFLIRHVQTVPQRAVRLQLFVPTNQELQILTSQMCVA